MTNFIIVTLGINITIINVALVYYFYKKFKNSIPDTELRICRNCDYCLTGRNILGELDRMCVLTYNSGYYKDKVKGTDTCGHFKFAENLLDYKMKKSLENSYNKSK